MKAKFLSASDLMVRWETLEELAIIAAVEDGLPCYCKNKYTWDIEALNRDRIKIDLKVGDILFDNFVFYLSDVEKFEADHPEMHQTIPINSKADDTLKLSAHAMLKQPIFKETMAAIKEIIAYCEKNTPCKKENAYEFYLKKHPKLTERIFDSIWAVIPAGIKRKRGQRDH